MSSQVIFLSILGAILIGAISPGPSFILVSRTAIAKGRAAGIAAALGMGAGGACLGGLALLGLSALLLRAEAVFVLAKILGGIYLVYLGLRIFRHASAPLVFEDGGPVRATSLGGVLVAGLLTQLSNPKTVIVYGSIFAALLPAQPERWLMLALVPMLFGVEAGWYLLVALVFSASGPRRAYARAKVWIDRSAGAVMAGLGTRLAAEGISSRVW
ncbi:LysE family translocator [Ciceribacter sp. RN22]|uniref:LysE family translocator n=1 Tax=Ciceribacter sp. RN22 TaxID=2954932 RepID=UPI00209253B0|nr:LysE family transporter [Ciceribacter sp. RN22]MCO6176885.1 LysE family transporter [Ciceribacter sp. RN22]